MICVFVGVFCLVKVWRGQLEDDGERSSGLKNALFVSSAIKPRTRAPIWHPDVCKIARHRSERLRMSILRKEGEGGGITRGN